MPLSAPNPTRRSEGSRRIARCGGECIHIDTSFAGRAYVPGFFILPNNSPYGTVDALYSRRKVGQQVIRGTEQPELVLRELLRDEKMVLEKKKLGVGECFGQAALMSMHKHAITAVATEESEVIVLSRHALNQLRHEDLALFALLMMNIARELARRLRLTDEMLIRSLHPQEVKPAQEPCPCAGS